MREDDAQAVLDALRMVKCVQSVEPVEGGYHQHMAEQRVRREFADKLWSVLYPESAK
jgi:hypothetical protein